MGRLDLRIVEARNLKNPDMFGKPDVYCKVELEGTKHKTSTQDDTLNPKWNEVFKFNVADENSSQLVFKLYNKEFGDDDFMGGYRLSLNGLVQGLVMDTWLLLQNVPHGELHVRVLAHDFGTEPQPEPPQYITFQQPPQYLPPPPQPAYVPPPVQYVPPAPVVTTNIPFDAPVNFAWVDKPREHEFSLPEKGMLFFEEATGKVSVLLDNQLRHIPNPDVFGRLFGVPLDPGAFNSFDGRKDYGEPISEDARLVRPENQPAIYLLNVEGGQLVKRHISNAAVFEMMTFNYSAVQPINVDELNAIPNGSAIPRPPPETLFFNEDDNKVHIFLDGGLRHVQNPEVFDRLFNVPLDPQQFCKYRGPLVFPEIEAMPLEAAIIRPDDRPEVYLLDNKGGRLVKRHIRSGEALAQMHGTFDKVDVRPNEAVRCYPTDVCIPQEELRYPRDGSFFHDNLSGRVSVFFDEDGCLRHIPNPQVFDALFNFPLDPDQMIRYEFEAGFPEGEALYGEACLARPVGAGEVYLMDIRCGVPCKRHIKSGEAMAKYRLSWDKVREMPPEFFDNFANAGALA